jgi:hypothetical protein
VTSIRVEGVAETLRILQRIDPDLRKELIKDLKQVTKPVVNAIKGNYADELVSGTARTWSPRGRTIFPWSRQKAVAGVKVKASSSKRNQTLLSIVQMDPAASVFDMAGKANDNPLATAFDTKFPKASRVMWRSYDEADKGMMDEIQKSVDKVMASLNDLQRAVLR